MPSWPVPSAYKRLFLFLKSHAVAVEGISKSLLGKKSPPAYEKGVDFGCHAAAFGAGS